MPTSQKANGLFSILKTEGRAIALKLKVLDKKLSGNDLAPTDLTNALSTDTKHNLLMSCLITLPDNKDNAHIINMLAAAYERHGLLNHESVKMALDTTIDNQMPNFEQALKSHGFTSAAKALAEKLEKLELEKERLETNKSAHTLSMVAKGQRYLDSTSASKGGMFANTGSRQVANSQNTGNGFNFK